MKIKIISFFNVVLFSIGAFITYDSVVNFSQFDLGATFGILYENKIYIYSWTTLLVLINICPLILQLFFKKKSIWIPLLVITINITLTIVYKEFLAP
jgi:hypothetical protein